MVTMKADTIVYGRENMKKFPKKSKYFYITKDKSISRTPYCIWNKKPMQMKKYNITKWGVPYKQPLFEMCDLNFEKASGIKLKGGKDSIIRCRLEIQ